MLLGPDNVLFCITFVKMTFACRRATTADEARQYHVAWGANENWNTSLGDADSLFAQDNHGFFLGELTENGTTSVIATLQVVKYDRDYVHIAAYQVLPQYRGKGYGKHFGIMAWSMRTTMIVL
jgi:GNAT superfamily N-acetyltransferase